ncbi:hypothetical protein VNO78_22024 [Psophocarpus tetragonolobus]|uniref:PSII 6.1 kDa protein n=1 Tax=Psophocarpus tetragonolobus TaxID=3891 RepID=A0AAN9SCL5_PSOTE
MATISAAITTPSITRAGVVQKRPLGISSPVLGLPAMGKMGRVRCSMEEKPCVKESSSSMEMGACLVAGVGAAAMSLSGPAMALVDERLSTEGTGLPFGLSNNLLGWILFGVFGLIWALYFVYTSSLEEDEESGLSL